MSQAMQQLEDAILTYLAENKFAELIDELRSRCTGTIDALEQIFQAHDSQSYKLFKKLRLIFEF
jgi:hypothetical protein